MAENEVKKPVNVTDALLGNKQAQNRGDEKRYSPKQMNKPSSKREPRAGEEPSEWTMKTVDVRRVTKVTKGGRTLRFSSIVVMGNKKGQVAMGTGKANEVSEAIKKGEQNAKKNLVTVKIVGTTIPHEQVGRHGTSKVLLWPTKEGNGIIAGGAARSVLELAGYKDVTAKIHGSTNKANVVMATIEALKSMRTKEEIATLRGKTVEQL